MRPVRYVSVVETADEVNEGVMIHGLRPDFDCEEYRVDGTDFSDGVPPPGPCDEHRLGSLGDNGQTAVLVCKVDKIFDVIERGLLRVGLVVKYVK